MGQRIPIRVVIADDHAIFRNLLRLYLSHEPGIAVVGEAATCREACLITEQEQPDVLLLDVDFGHESSLDSIPELRRIAPNSSILMLTGIRDAAVHQLAVRLGAVGLMLKEQPLETLVRAIRSVASGEAWLDANLVASVLSIMSRTHGEPLNQDALRIASLTERERQVIRGICKGWPNRTMAEHLIISENTVRHHLTSIFSKLNLQSRLELVVYAYKHGLDQ